MKFFEKTKGAVSIFLVIILVPMMTVSALFVDASKVKLGRAMAESAGDLTLNTALTDYDTQLKNLYGLMATAQDTSDLFGKLEDYYRTCIISSGVGEGDADLYVERIMAQLGLISESNDTADIMNLNLLDFSAEKLTDADLANATMLKKQIVDFMKYRAPINTGLSFVSSLKSFSTLKKQTDLVDKKKAYYEAQKTVMESLKEAWSNIADYNGSQASNKTYLDGIKTTMNGFESSYKDYGRRTLKSLYNKYDTVVRFKFHIDITPVTNYSYDLATGQKTSESFNDWRLSYDGTTCYDNYDDNFNKQYSIANKKLPTVDEIKSAINGYRNAYKTIKELKYAPPYNSGSDYSIQFISHYKNEMTNCASTGLNFFMAYQKMENAILWINGYDLTDVTDNDGNKITAQSINDTQITIGNSTKKISQWITDTASNCPYSGTMNDFKNTMAIYNSVADSAYNEYFARWQITQSEDISTAIYNKYVVANAYYTTLTNAINSLDLANQHLGNAKSKLEGAAKTAKGVWKKAAEDSDIKGTSTAKQDVAEINQLDTYLNGTNIQQLIDRISKVKTGLEGVRAELLKYTFADSFIGNIDGYSGDNGLEKVCGNKWNDLNSLSVNNAEVEQTAQSRASGAWHSGDISLNWASGEGDPNLAGNNKPKMYSYLYSHFGSVSAAKSGDDSQKTTKAKEDPDNGENYYNNIKNTSKSGADAQKKDADSGQAGANTKDNNINSLGDGYAALPSTHAGDKTTIKGDNTSTDPEEASKSGSNALDGLFGGKFLGAIKEMGTDLRDNLYITDYVMSMFSYDTIENEYAINHNNTKPQAGDILSLTKNDISPANNYAYGCEVEYIIYGGSNASNLTKAYASIFGIRFGFNLIYAFATSEIRESALAIATPISAATLGVIPVPLIQAVIIIGMACIESGIDLAELKAGKSIPLYKNNKTWRCSISGLANLATEELKNAAGDVVDKGLEKLNEYLDMGEEDLNGIIQSGTNNIQQSVGEVYDKIITDNANAAIQELTTQINSAVETLRLASATEYANQKATLKNNIKSNMQSWGNQFTGNDLASKVKREAVNVITSHSDTMIDGLFNEMENAILTTNAGASVSDVISNVSESANGIDQLGGKVMTVIQNIRTSINDTIQYGSNEVQNYISNAKNELSEAAKGGATKLKETLNSQIDGIFGSEGSAGESTGMAGLFSFSYSDYLRLFTIISLYTSPEYTILHIADVIQVNMATKIANDKAYELAKSAVYVKVTADVQVQPTLLALPLFADVKNNPKDNTNWYTIKYTGIAGY